MYKVYGLYSVLEIANYKYVGYSLFKYYNYISKYIDIHLCGI